MKKFVVYTERREVTRHTVEISDEKHGEIIRAIERADFGNHDQVVDQICRELLKLDTVKVTDVNMNGEAKPFGLYDTSTEIEYYD